MEMSKKQISRNLQQNQPVHQVRIQMPKIFALEK